MLTSEINSCLDAKFQLYKQCTKLDLKIEPFVNQKEILERGFTLKESSLKETNQSWAQLQAMLAEAEKEGSAIEAIIPLGLSEVLLNLMTSADITVASSNLADSSISITPT